MEKYSWLPKRGLVRPEVANCNWCWEKKFSWGFVIVCGNNTRVRWEKNQAHVFYSVDWYKILMLQKKMEIGGTPSYDLPLKDNFWCSIPLVFRNCQNLSSNSWCSMLGVQNLSKFWPLCKTIIMLQMKMEILQFIVQQHCIDGHWH